MSDQTSNTPRSNSESNAPKLSAPKDKNCPFCHQAFTSSSLGRHLDLYIKAKNPKPPDGVHDVEEIRRMRGGITRRQARTSSQKAESQTPVSKPPPPPMSDSGSPMIVHSPSELNSVPGGGPMKIRINQAHWQATGVINNLPPRQNVVSMPEMRREVSRHQQQKTDFEKRQQLSEEWENLKAAELALKEVLTSVRDASVRSTGLGLFEFDPYTLNFPSLCLHILPAPPTLFSPTPFPTNESWSINPPGQKQFDALQRAVRERLMAYQRQRQHQQLHPQLTNGSASNSPLPTPPLYDPDPNKLFAHLHDAYAHWKGLPEKQRQDTWQLEILRSYVRADEARKEAENSLESARREIEHLKSSRWVNMGMGHSQNPFSPSATLHLPADTVRELGKQGMDIRSWDFERLVDKWKNVVRENRKAANGMNAQRSLSVSSAAQHQLNNTGNNTRTVSGSSDISNVKTNGINGISGASQPTVTASAPFSLPQATSQDSSMTDDVNDQADGDGESDDADAEEAPEEAPMPQQPPPQAWGRPPPNHPPSNPHTPTPQQHYQQQHQQQVQQQQQHFHHGLTQQFGHQPSGRRTPQSMMDPRNGPGGGPPTLITMDGLETSAQGYLDRNMALQMGFTGDLVGLTGPVTQGD